MVLHSKLRVQQSAEDHYYVRPALTSVLWSMTTPYALCRVALILRNRKTDLLDPLDDDDDIKWKANPFDADSLDGSTELKFVENLQQWNQ